MEKETGDAVRNSIKMRFLKDAEIKKRWNLVRFFWLFVVVVVVVSTSAAFTEPGCLVCVSVCVTKPKAKGINPTMHFFVFPD